MSTRRLWLSAVSVIIVGLTYGCAPSGDSGTTAPEGGTSLSKTASAGTAGDEDAAEKAEAADAATEGDEAQEGDPDDAGPVGEPHRPGDPFTAKGTIMVVNTDEDRIELVTASEEALMFKVTSKAKIERRGRKAELGDLRIGDEVTLTYGDRSTWEIIELEVTETAG